MCVGMRYAQSYFQSKTFQEYIFLTLHITFLVMKDEKIPCQNYQKHGKKERNIKKDEEERKVEVDLSFVFILNRPITKVMSYL